MIGYSNIDVGTHGAATCNECIEVVSFTRFGLMAQLAATGVKLEDEPISP